MQEELERGRVYCCKKGRRFILEESSPAVIMESGSKSECLGCELDKLEVSEDVVGVGFCILLRPAVNIETRFEKYELDGLKKSYDTLMEYCEIRKDIYKDEGREEFVCIECECWNDLYEVCVAGMFDFVYKKLMANYSKEE